MLQLNETVGHPLPPFTKQRRQLRSNTVKPSSSSSSSSASSPRPRHRKTSHSSSKHSSATTHPKSGKASPTSPYSSASYAEQQMPSGSSKMVAGVNYTKTGRISKAKKGLKVHSCACGKSYTRAEHLRRHQSNHAQKGTFVCMFPDCVRSFFRADLLQRHQEKHDMSREQSLPSVSSQGETPEALPTSGHTPEPPIVAPTLPQPAHYHFSQIASPAHNSVTVPRYTQNSFRTPQIPRTPKVLSSGFNNFIRSSPITSSFIHPKQRNLYPSRQSLPISSSTEYMNHNIGWNDSFGQSPGYSSSSGYASPNPGAGDYANMFVTPNYGSGPCRTRTSSNASFIESWSFQSQSPMSCASTIPHTWTSNDKTPTISSFPYTFSSDTLIDMPFPDDLDNPSPYGPYGSRIMATRDKADEIVLFPEQQHGMNQITNTYPSENFLDSYWRLFHPYFPIVHRPTFGSVSPSPLLFAAMIAIGGHYSTDLSVKRKSRELHKRCIKLLEQRHQSTEFGFDRLCDYQAIFLIEVISQYRSRRAATTLSPRFMTMYCKLAENFQSIMSQISDVTSSLTQPESTTVDQWNKWIFLSTQQHLFLSCYLLEYQQAILLAREPQQRFVQESGISLPIPAHYSVWESPSAVEWAVAAQQHSCIPKQVFETHSNLIGMSFDLFQSSVLIAAHYNHSDNPKPCLAPILAMSFEELLDTSPITKHKLFTAKLLQVAPVRALLAVSGESWVLAEKITSPQDFSTLESTLRTWISQLWSPSVNETYHVSAREALALSIAILEQALVEGPDYLTPEMGAEMGLYFAALVVWIATVAATTRVMGSQHVVEQRSSLQSILPIDPDITIDLHSTSTPMFPPDASLASDPIQPAALGLVLEQDALPIEASSFDIGSLCSHSQLNPTTISFLSATLQGLGCDSSPDTVLRCQISCTSLLLWTKMRLIGAETVQNTHVGSDDERYGGLLNSVIGSLERILNKSWGEWGI